MAAEVKLRLDLRDVYGKFLGETVDVVTRNQVLLSEIKRFPVNAKAKADLVGLLGGPEGRYRIDIDPPSYQYLTKLITLKSSGITEFSFTCPIDPDKVTDVKFTEYAKLVADLRALLERSDKVLGSVGKKGEELYGSLDNIRKAGLMNIAAKLNATRFPNGRTGLSYVGELNELRGDRFFAVVPKELREETKNSVDAGLFKKADQSLHHPPPGFDAAGSFKTHDKYGNLQLTFFMNDNSDCVADIDIDDAGGFEHIFQVLGNKLSGKPTHPYNIHEILVWRQKLDPGYTFVL